MFSVGANILGCIFQLIWPARCAACGTNDPTRDGFCERCSRGLLRLASLDYCPRCGATLGAGLPAGEDGCYACPTVMPRFDRLVRVGPYAAPLRQAIQQMKYRAAPHRPEHLARLLAEGIQAHCDARALDVVLAVPMHWLRRLSRGRNHSAALAAGAAARLRLPMGDELVRVRNTPPQVHLPASKRAENVRGAFAVTRTRAIAAASVLLVDDVTTTGATANEATRTLLAAGAARVTLAVLAKAEPPTAHATILHA